MCSNDTTDACIIMSCSHLRRLIAALEFFERLSSSESSEKVSAVFSDFCNEYYPAFLSDYIHFTRKHLDDWQAIKEDAESTFEIKCCSASSCKLQRRDIRKRQSRGGGKGKSKCDTDSNLFYRDIMANTHFLLQHLHEHGLRTIPTMPTMLTSPEHKEEEQDVEDTEQ